MLLARSGTYAASYTQLASHQATRTLNQTIGSMRHSSSHAKAQRCIKASYYRGGTSRAVIFQRKDLPENQKDWAPIFRSIIGSPDSENGRQLDGMGGGLSSLSKVCVISPSEDANADVDYTFVAIGVWDNEVDYSSNCGNMSSAVGPFAVDAGLVDVGGPAQEEVTVRIRNTNTGKFIESRFPTDETGKASSYGDFSIDGVAGTAAKIKLTFLNPSGSKTGKLLPTGNPKDFFEGVEATCIDVGNPCVFVSASSLQTAGDASPDAITSDTQLLKRLDSIRRQAGVKMGLAQSPDQVPGSIPKIAMVSPGKTCADGTLQGDIVVRAMSVGQPHKAVPITVAMALAGATKVPGSVANAVSKSSHGKSPDPDGVTILHPTGTILVSSTKDEDGNIKDASVFRTARLLMSGDVHIK